MEICERKEKGLSQSLLWNRMVSSLKVLKKLKALIRILAVFFPSQVCEQMRTIYLYLLRASLRWMILYFIAKELKPC